jgi:MFS family permease
MTETPDARTTGATSAPAAGTPAKSDLNWPLFLSLVASTIMVNAVVSLSRVTTSYRAIELNLSVVWIGIIAAGFSLVPVLLAVQVGRFIDRGHDALSVWVGVGLMLLASIGMWWQPDSALHLLVFSIMLGFGHMFCMAGQQMIAVRCGGPITREHVFGYHMIAIATGQGLGPMLLGWLGGGTPIPPTGELFTMAMIGAGLSFVVAFGIRPATGEAARRKTTEHVRVLDLLRQRGLVAVLLASIVTVTAFELMTVYLPLLAIERQIDTHHVGYLLATRSAVSIATRLFYAKLVMSVGRARLMVSSMTVGALAFIVLGLPVPLAAMYFGVVMLGIGLGIASTLTFSEVVVLAPLHARATALSLRVTGNRIGQMLVPAIAGVVAGVTGIGGVMLILSAFLAASGAFTHFSLKRS